MFDFCTPHQLLAPKPALDQIKVHLHSRTSLSLAARDTVEPAVEKLTDKFQLDLSLVARDTVEPVIEKSQKNIVPNLICMICMFA